MHILAFLGIICCTFIYHLHRSFLGEVMGLVDLSRQAKDESKIMKGRRWFIDTLFL